VRCYDCHSTLPTRLRLEPLQSGNPSWTEDQSRKNFAFVQQLLTAGDPMKSRLLLHPLAPAAGGDPVHTGGKFWPEQHGGFGRAEGRLGTPSHGIGVAPDGKSLWVNSTVANAVFTYSLPDLKLIGFSALPLVHPLNHAVSGAVPEWITFTPDSERVFVSNSTARSVSVIDARTLKSVAEIPVGEVPKRINTLILR
jgi:YVTN family beta-propeller protein